MNIEEKILKIWEARLASKTLKIIFKGMSFYEYEINDDQSKKVLLIEKEMEFTPGPFDDPRPSEFRIKYGDYSIITKSDKAESLYKITKAIVEEEITKVIEEEITKVIEEELRERGL